MLTKVIVDLKYVATGKSANGSPTELIITESNVRADLINSFSQNYYQNNQRIMRQARNFTIAEYLTHDRINSNNRYELMYVEYDGLKYRIKNILKHKSSNLRMILDCDEVK